MMRGGFQKGVVRGGPARRTGSAKAWCVVLGVWLGMITAGPAAAQSELPGDDPAAWLVEASVQARRISGVGEQLTAALQTKGALLAYIAAAQRTLGETADATRNEKLVGLCVRALAHDGEDGWVHAARARALGEQGRADEAESALAQISREEEQAAARVWVADAARASAAGQGVGRRFASQLDWFDTQQAIRRDAASVGRHGTLRDAQVWVEVLSDPAERAWASLGIAEGLALALPRAKPGATIERSAAEAEAEAEAEVQPDAASEVDAIAMAILDPAPVAERVADPAPDTAGGPTAREAPFEAKQGSAEISAKEIDPKVVVPVDPVLAQATAADVEFEAQAEAPITTTPAPAGVSAEPAAVDSPATEAQATEAQATEAQATEAQATEAQAGEVHANANANPAAVEPIAIESETTPTIESETPTPPTEAKAAAATVVESPNEPQDEPATTSSTTTTATTTPADSQAATPDLLAQPESAAAPPPSPTPRIPAVPNLASLADPAAVLRRAPADDVVDLEFTTTKGVFTVRVHREWAPLAADRFCALAAAGFYHNQRFFRVVPGFVVQWGIHGYPNVAAAWRTQTLPDEPRTQPNRRGTIVFAAATQPNTRTTQVFINLADNAFLDDLGFVPFGEITEGLDVVDALFGGHGETPSTQQREIQLQGNAFLDAQYPDLDSVISIQFAP